MASPCLTLNAVLFMTLIHDTWSCNLLPFLLHSIASFLYHSLSSFCQWMFGLRLPWGCSWLCCVNTVVRAFWGTRVCRAEFSPTLGNLRKACSSLSLIFKLLGCLWFLLICRWSVHILDMSLLFDMFAFNPWFAFLLSCLMVAVYLGNLCPPQMHADVLLCYLQRVLLFYLSYLEFMLS